LKLTLDLELFGTISNMMAAVEKSEIVLIFMVFLLFKKSEPSVKVGQPE